MNQDPLRPAGAPRARRGVRRSRAVLCVERLLLLVAVVALGWTLQQTVGTHISQAAGHRDLNRLLAEAGNRERGGAESGQRRRRTPQELAGESADPSRSSAKAPTEGALIGRIDVPRLGISAIVREGTSDATLRKAVGRIPETALPGQSGNVGLAGHRDSFFRPLRYVQQDDEISLTTPGGVFRYRVESTKIVNPKDVWVLDPRDRQMLTLVTCYPFHYIGNAPRRFIVWASAIDSPSHTN